MSSNGTSGPLGRPAAKCRASVPHGGISSEYIVTRAQSPGPPTGQICGLFIHVRARGLRKPAACL